jgi:hypothetical protein
LDDLPDEAVECRGLRHAWPRGTNPAHRENIHFEVTEKRGGRVIAGVLHLTCTAGCGRIRKEPRRRNRHGQLVREFGRRLSYTQTPGTRYLLKPPPGESAVRVDPADVQDRLLHRLCPGLRW